MTRLGLFGLAVVLIGATVAGYFVADTDARLQSVAILVKADQPGCDGPGQFWLQIGNASEQTLARIDGIVSGERTETGSLVPAGNFSLATNLPPLGQTTACVVLSNPAEAGSLPPRTARWLARATAVVIAEDVGTGAR